MVIQQLHTYCAMCTSRCGVLATVQDGVLTRVTPDPDHPNGCICVKGAAAPEIVYSPDRLQYPMIRTRPKTEHDPGWKRVTWDEALGLIASRLLDIKARYGAEAVVFSRSTPAGSASVDFQRWLQRLANAFGSPNLMTTTHICTWNKEWGAKNTYGVMTPPQNYEQTRCILLWGTNPEATEPAAAMRIRKAQTRGARLIVIDPRGHSLAQKADVWLRVRPGSDGILALAMIHVLLDERLYDAAFVRDWTNAVFLVREDTERLLTERDLRSGGDPERFVVWDTRRQAPVMYHSALGYEHAEVEPALSGSFAISLIDGRTVTCRPVLQALSDIAAEYAPERSAKLTWVPASEVRRAVRMFALEKPSCYATWVGLEQHSRAGQTNRAVCCFYALTGQFDERGSNVVFAATPTRPTTGIDLLPREQVQRRLGLDEHPVGPQLDPGTVTASDVYRAILTAEPYPVKAMVLFGSDPLLSHGDPLRGRAALETLDFYVHMDMVANPSSTLADVLLPANTCWEHAALMPGFRGENGATWAQLRPPVVNPMHESRSDLEVIFDLATRMKLGAHFFDGDIDAAFNFELAPSGLTVEQLRDHPGGMRAAGRTRHKKYAEVDAVTGRPRGFATPSGKLEIYASHFARAGHPPLPVWQESTDSRVESSAAEQEYPLLLTFSRVVQFCDDQHRNIPRLRRQAPQPLIEIHPATASGLDIDDGEWAVLETEKGQVRLKTKLNALLDPRVVSTQYGWWQACRELDLPGYAPLAPDGANANLLISNDAVDPISNSIQHRGLRCRVRKIDTSVSGADEQAHERASAD